MGEFTHFLPRDQQPQWTQAGETGRISGPGSAQGRTMASRGSELSTRMSAEDENIENKSINDIALKYFKKYKVEISDAIRTTFPFLELLRDHELITTEMYEDSQESFKKWCSVHLVIYNVLSELEKKFDMSLLGVLFSKTIMKNYPDLFRIYKIFYKAIPDIEFLLKHDGEENEERPNDQLRLEQGTGGSSYQRLMWLGPDAWNYNDTAPPEPGLLELRHDTPEINATETDTTSDNEDALKSQQTNEQRAQESKTAGVECEAQARIDRNQVSDVIVINSQDFEEFTDEDEPPKGSTSALKRKPESMDSRKSSTSGQIPCKTGEELLHQGNQNTSCSVNPMGIEKEKPFLYSGVECEAKARTDCNQASDVIVIDSQDFAEFTDGDGPPETSTTALNREPESVDFRKSPTSGKILCKTGEELLHQGNQNTSCSVNPVDIKEEKPFLYSGVECEAKARTDCNEASDVIVIDSQDFAEFTDGDGPPETSTTALNREPESMDFRKSPISGKILCKTGRSIEDSLGFCAEKKPLVTCSSAVRISEMSSRFSAENKQPEACSSAVRVSEVSSGFSAQNKPPGPCSSAVRNPDVPSGFSAQNKPQGPCSSAVRVSQVSSGFSAQNKPPGPCSSAVRVSQVSSGFSAQNKPPGPCSSAVRVSQVPSGLSAQNKPPGPCSSAVRNPDVPSGLSAQNKPPGPCSSAVRNPDVPSGLSAQNKPPGPCSSAVRNPDVPLGFSAQNKPPGPCSSAVRVSQVSSGFSAQNKPPGLCSSAVRVYQVSSGFSAQNKPPGPCSSAVRSPEVSSGFSAQKKPPVACTSAVRASEVTSRFSAQNKPPGACTSAVRIFVESSEFSAQNKPPGPCSSAVRSLEGSSGFGAQNKPPGACSSAVGSLEGSSGFTAQSKPTGACSFALRIGADEKGTVHLGKKSTLEKAEKKKRSRKHKEENANFHSEILPVTCGKIEGMLYVKKFKQGTKRKCIRSQDGNWFNPKEFEEKAGYGTSKSRWKTRVRSNGKTLKSLMKKGRLPTPPVERDRSKKLRSSEVCKICCREGNLFCCITCLSFFHGDCHLPPVETERSPWHCTLCRVKECSGSQQSARESEVLARPMGPESQLKCEFLLLMFYCHSESNGFQNIQRDHYRIENFQCMADFLVMDEIKKKLRERRYLNVMEFMQDVRHIFLVHRASKKCNNFCWGIRQEEKFELNFKQVFAVQETEQEHTTKLN